MQVKADRPEAPSAIRSDLGAIFVSLELSRSIWLITSLSPGAGEKMSKHSVPAGDIGALLARFSEMKQKAFARTGKSFPIIVIQEAGLDGFWIHRVLQKEGIESHVVDPASIATSRRRRRQRPTGSTAKRCCAHCSLTSAANLGCARWSKRRLLKKRTAAVSAASARY
jgi:transposase